MFKMTVHGGEELAQRLNALPAAFSRSKIIAALKAGGEPIRAAAASKAPREPGAPDLADNIVISTTNRILGETRDEQEHAVAIGPSKHFFYGLMQEYGTVFHGAQPFMRPAFDTKGPEALGIIGQHLWAALRKQAGSSPNLGTVGGRFV